MGVEGDGFSRKALLMGRLRARDLLLPPSLVSLLRVPLAAVFPVVVERPWLALLVLVASGVSDLVDGYLARRYGQATATGALLDGATDKLFVGTVALTLLLHGNLSVLGTLALGLRDLGELPLVGWLALSRGRRMARAEDPKANYLGKLATVCQFAAVMAALFRSPVLSPLLIASAVVGVVAAASYWRRELAAHSGREDRPGSS